MALLRWRIATLVSIAIAISYLDRQTLPVAVSAIAKDIPLSNQGFSALQSAFLLSYAFMYLGGGKLVDSLGTRIGFAIIMTFWSLANASHALATSFAMLMGSRFLLGMGEGGGFPAATRAVAEWFPTKDRASAMGIINAGSAVGGVIAPPLIALVLGYAGWRWIFVITGGFGLVWTLWWISSYFSPANPPEQIGQDSVTNLANSATRIRWIDLLRIRESWGLVSAKFLSDAAWYFYLFWLPKFLKAEFKLTKEDIALPVAIVYVIASFGSIFGGWLPMRFIKNGWPVFKARKNSMLIKITTCGISGIYSYYQM